MNPRAASALLSVLGVLAALALWQGFSALLAPTIAATPGDRIGLASAALLPAGVVLAAMVVAQMAGRAITGSIDPTAGQDNHFLQVNQRVISNTVEQLAILGPALAALATRVPPEQIGRVMALGLVFAVARLVFWAGYLWHPVLRAVGMAPSFGVSAVSLVAAIMVWL